MRAWLEAVIKREELYTPCPTKCETSPAAGWEDAKRDRWPGRLRVRDDADELMAGSCRMPDLPGAV